MEIAHVTSAALDENAKAGRHVVKIIPVDLTGTEQKEVALGTLELGRTGDSWRVGCEWLACWLVRTPGKGPKAGRQNGG